MARDSEKDELPSFVTRRPAQKSPSREDIDHLTHLLKVLRQEKPAKP